MITVFLTTSSPDPTLAQQPPLNQTHTPAQLLRRMEYKLILIKIVPTEKSKKTVSVSV